MATRVGFTGTQQGLSSKQLRTLYLLLGIIKPDWWCDGDCVGADAEGHIVAETWGISTCGHPPKNSSKRAYSRFTVMQPQDEYLVRNQHIVNHCDLLIVGPQGPEVLRSGTWSTYRYAKRLHRPIIVLSR